MTTQLAAIEIHDAPLGIREMIDQNPMVGEARTGAKRAWTTREIDILRKTYPKSGLPGCLPFLPGRSASTIYQQAAKHEIAAPRGVRGAARQAWPSSPQMDAVIRRVYQGTPTRGEVKKLAATLGRPRWWISKRAAAMGLQVQRFRELPWTEEEIEFAAARAHKNPHALSIMMKRRGFSRTATAITVKMKRMGQPTGKNADLDQYTANHLAMLFGVDRSVVAGWIVKGWLVAKRRGTARTPAQGGDEFRIHRRDVRRFVMENTAAIDIRKVEKFWFVEMLTAMDSTRGTAGAVTSHDRGEA